MYNSTKNQRMKSPRDLEADLEKYQDLYDKSENNPVMQADLQVKIAKCIRQLGLWDDLYKSIR